MLTRRDYLKTAAAVAATAAGDVTDAEHAAQQSRLVDLAERDEAERWSYDTECNLAHIRSGLINAEVDALCEEPDGTVETYPVTNRGIPLAFTVSTDGDESVGTLVNLSADQAEALAVDLLEQAHTARERDHAE